MTKKLIPITSAMFHIHIAVGTIEEVRLFHFVALDRTKSIDEQKTMFNNAVQELNHVYKDYGRFATNFGVIKLFKKFGFEETVP